VDIELRLLRSFVQMHEAGSISRAADRMACTQAAMSMRLKMLETEIGAPLFIRTPQGLQPTPRGAELYAKALGVLSAYDELMSLTRTRPPRDRVRIGLPDDYALGWLGQALETLAPQLDRLEIEIACDLSANLMAAVQRQDLDMALVTLAARPSQSVAEVDLPLVWVRKPGAVLPEVRLAAYPEGCVFRRAMIGALDSAGTGWRVGVQSRSHAGIFAAVRAGVAVTSVARGTAPADLEEIASAKGLPALPRVPVYLVAAPAQRPAALRLQQALQTRLLQAAV
jgi:DNA-binding transcriptional LysR family regulator